jgi:segregation and condensation protein B
MEATEVTELTKTDDAIADAEPAGDHPLPEADDALGRVERIIESVLFAAAAPVSLRRLVDILEGPSAKEVQAAMARLQQQYAPGQRGIQVHEVAGGYQLRTARENAEWVRAVFRDKPARLGRAALETLAIVAYKQPVTRSEIEAIRGVDVDGVVATLLARRLIKISGRKEAVGRPLLYTTTAEFLEAFGLKDLNDLPSLKELGPVTDAEEHDTARETAPPDATAQESAGALAEDSQPGGDGIAPPGRNNDPDGAGAPEWAAGHPVGDKSEPEHRSDHD